MPKRALSALLAAALLASLALLLTEPAAKATFPGRPGEILYDSAPGESACGGAHIFTLHPDGRHSTELAAGSQGSFSPGGDLIAFTSCKGNTFSQISVMGADGSDPREVISRDFSASEPSFSPDGRHLVFVRSEFEAGENPDLMTSTVGGTHLRPLTRTPHASETDPSYSPDGHLIAFSSVGHTRASRHHIFTIRPGGGGLRNLGPGSRPSISPNGRLIAYQLHGGIWLMRTDGRDPHEIKAAGASSGAADPRHERFRNSSPVFSPGGGRILFVRHRMLPVVGGLPKNYVLWAMGLDGDNVTRVSPAEEESVVEHDPDWQAR